MLTSQPFETLGGAFADAPQARYRHVHCLPARWWTKRGRRFGKLPTGNNRSLWSESNIVREEGGRFCFPEVLN